MYQWSCEGGLISSFSSRTAPCLFSSLQVGPVHQQQLLRRRPVPREPPDHHAPHPVCPLPSGRELLGRRPALPQRPDRHAQRPVISPPPQVGPVHQLQGRHRDGRTLALAVQVVGRPGPNQPVTAILRLDASGGPPPAPPPPAPPPKDVPAAAAAATGPVRGLHNKPSFAPNPERGMNRQGSMASRVSAGMGRNGGNGATAAAGQGRVDSPREPQQQPPSGAATSRPLHTRRPQQRPDQDPAQIPGTVDGEAERSTEPGGMAVQPQVSRRSVHLAGPSTPDHGKAAAAVPQMGSGEQLDTPRAQLAADVSEVSAAPSAAVAAVAAPRRGMATLVSLGKGEMPMPKACGGSGKAPAASPLATAVATAMAAKQPPPSDAREDSGGYRMLHV